ncbi:circadian associated repressor of transcription a [Chanos chanos]|uniref:Circadian associated repressor of transcription a n=1 Tax=Chanos chanos TaxID=29144 RepID=A0A6J2WJ62_CHACN|nr:uncharacterized protein LOC115824817 [Chanos chanos]
MTEGTLGDITFAQKCAELRGYIRPLLELLNGLKMGRYDKGLSTFQQSVAMDRLQRILGILQKPYLGEKHLRTLLQLEMMLKVWFPQVKAAAAPQNSTGLPPARWHQDQLHIPVKKRRLSWSDSESSSPGQPFSKRPQEEDQHECQSDTSTGAPSSVHGETRGGGAQWMDFKKKIISGHCLKGSNHISSQPDLLSGSTQGVQKGTPSSLKMPPSSSGTQDSWISSTTPSSDSPQPSLLRQPSTGHRRDSVSLETEGNRAISTQGAESC